MKAALVTGPGRSPSYGSIEEPVAAAGESRITVAAAALHHVVAHRAAGIHYSSSHGFPFVAGIDGVGRLEDGRRVYFMLPRPPYGSMAEVAVAPVAHHVAVPDGVDDITAAAIANPGLSSWTAFRERAKLVAGESVLINGATGVSGRLAVRIAKHLGARKVVATGRNRAVLESLKSQGADVTIPLAEDRDALQSAFKEHFADGIDVVLDYLWGATAECLLLARAKAGHASVRTRIVQVGSLTGATITLPSALLRSTAIELMGSGLGSVSTDRIVTTVGELLQAAATADFPVATKGVPLTEVEPTWTTGGFDPRIVFTIG